MCHAEDQNDVNSGRIVIGDKPDKHVEKTNNPDIKDLVQRINELQRALQKAESTQSHDGMLQWQGRSRFLTEKIVPVRLKYIPEASCQPKKGGNIVIEGDNLSVMTSLLSDYRGGASKGFDVIYMDPPYNTGNDVFSYNDDYNLKKDEIKELRTKGKLSEEIVNLDDPTRHTKWINHMAPRLWAAKKLMKQTGVIIVFF